MFPYNVKLQGSHVNICMNFNSLISVPLLECADYSQIVGALQNNYRAQSLFWIHKLDPDKAVVPEFLCDGSLEATVFIGWMFRSALWDIERIRG